MANFQIIDSDKLNSNLTLIADSIRSKNNTTEKLSFPDGFKNAIDTISSSGGVTVQRYPATGTGSVRIGGTATTVTCGFKPDAILFFGTNPQDNNSAMHAGVAFTEANVTTMNTIFTPSSTSYIFSVLHVTQTSTGFTIRGTRADTSFNISSESGYRTINYVAIKYS